MSDIRVSVQWKSSTVFAGEEIECTITFKNVAQVRNFHRSPSPNLNPRRLGSSRERWKDQLPSRSLKSPAGSNYNTSRSISGVSKPNAKTHRPALSLSTSNGSASTRLPGTPGSVGRETNLENNKHRRSVSIVSIGGNSIDETPSPNTVTSSGRPLGHHVRAASLQVLPRRSHKPDSGSQSVSGHDRAFTVPSPLMRSSSSFAGQRVGSRPTVGSDTNYVPPMTKMDNHNSFSNFKFAQGMDNPEKSAGSGRLSSIHAEKPASQLRRALSPRPHHSLHENGPLSPPTKILSPAYTDDTPRSSGEFYSMSNNSTETLASEYITRENSRLLHRPAHSRQGSSLAPIKASKPEVLMMGYAQISGSFTLDGSLVNQSHFEGAKKKGIIGGQGGGGLVRTESTKRDSGLLGSLGWGNIGDSIGGFLTSNEMSTIKEAKVMGSSRAIPILSTPQSILFVDLQLGPGESRSYTYRHPLPRGIPPTHRGRAMKTSYNLVVGTQRTAKLTQQHQVQHVDIPFRVLSSVNEHGDVLGHDLMSPHTILSDIASISSTESPGNIRDSSEGPPSFLESSSSPTDFLIYVENLLQKPRQYSGASLLSPTDPDPRHLAPSAEGSSTMKDLIDLAVLRSNAATSTKRSANRFEIARSGDRVAVIMLPRPAYRLGETVPVVVDFQDSDIRCYSLHAALETTEVIDQAIALRSKASIHRVTRRVYASHSEMTLAAKKVLFNPMIPVSSTPDFVTSGINLEWKLRFEFITSRIGDNEEMEEGLMDLMEEVARDERGSVKAAVQGLACESFDVTVPLKVYGSSPNFDEKIEPDDFPI